MIEQAPESAGLLATLGIDWKLFLAQLVNFGIVVLVLWKWAYKPLLDMLDKRKKAIAESLEKNKSIDERMKRIGAEEGAMMKAAHLKAQEVLSGAERDAKERMQQATDQTKQHVDAMILNGQNELTVMKSHLLTEAQKDLADIVVAATEKVVGETADKKTHADLVKKAQEALKKL
ncbi:MAG: F0F1 ATP synthase subunit B [bacterium]